MKATNSPGAQVSFPDDKSVSVTRVFQAPRELVYKAYTTPTLIQQWLLGPPGWSMPICEMDVRQGGKFRWRWKSDEDGSEFGFHGEFLSVDPPNKIVHTEIFDPGTVGGEMGEAAIVTLTLPPLGDDATTMNVTIAYDTKDARDAAVSTGMTDGMEASYQMLDRLLENG